MVFVESAFMARNLWGGGIILINNFWSLCWSKLFLVLMELITIYFCGKICMFMTDDIEKAVLAALLIMASPEIMMSVGYSGQDEMTYVCLPYRYIIS